MAIVGLTQEANNDDAADDCSHNEPCVARAAATVPASAGRSITIVTAAIHCFSPGFFSNVQSCIVVRAFYWFRAGHRT